MLTEEDAVSFKCTRLDVSAEQEDRVRSCDEKSEETPHPSESLLRGNPIENAFQFDQMLERNCQKYAHLFKDFAEYTDFMMLPVRDEWRADLLVKMSEDAKARREIAAYQAPNAKVVRRFSE